MVLLSLLGAACREVTKSRSRCVGRSRMTSGGGMMTKAAMESVKSSLARPPRCSTWASAVWCGELWQWHHPFALYANWWAGMWGAGVLHCDCQLLSQSFTMQGVRASGHSGRAAAVGPLPYWNDCRTSGWVRPSGGIEILTLLSVFFFFPSVQRSFVFGESNHRSSGASSPQQPHIELQPVPLSRPTSR